MKCSLHIAPSMSQRELIYLSVYWFEGGKTGLEERTLALDRSK